MNVANVVIRTSYTESVGETRTAQRTFVRVIPIEVASVATEGSFIPLETEIPLSDKDSVISVLAVQPEIDFGKDRKPTKFQSIDMAKLKAALHFEFVQKKFRTLAVVELPYGKIYSRDPYRQPESYRPQVALIPIWGSTKLPDGAKVADAIECEGYAVSAQDEETGQEYFLGYRFDSADDVNWVDLVLARRKHWKASEKEEDFQAPAPVKAQSTVQNEDIAPANLAHVKDKYVLKQLKRIYRYSLLRSQQIAGRGWLIEDPDKRLSEAEKYVAGRRQDFVNQGKNVEHAMEREFFPELYV